MTPEEYQNSLNNRFALEIKAMEDAFLATVKDAVGNMGVRIFEEGKNSGNQSIGQYNDTKEIYVSGTGTHKGKPNKKTGKRKTIKTTYYESYKSFRSIKGRPTGFVNLKFDGRLMSDFFNAPVSDKIPADATPIKVSPFEYYTRIRDDNSNKLKGAEHKFGKSIKIFAHTKEERERFNRTLNFELNERLKRINA